MSKDDFAALKVCLSRGFLSKSYSAEIGDRSFTFLVKNVTPIEAARVKHLLPPPDSRWSAQRRKLHQRACLVALGIASINGVNYLDQRPQILHKLVPLLKGLPTQVFEALLGLLLKLNQNFSKVSMLVPVFSDKPYSRQLWSTLKSGLSITSPEWTGWPGTERIGHSPIHISWTHLQRVLDKFDELDAMWTTATVLAASQSKELHRYMVNEKKRRDSVRRNIGLDSSASSRKVHGVAVNKTLKDLLDEIDREERGEWDEHDQAVQDFEDSFLNEYLESQQRIAEQVSRGEFFEEGPAVVSTSKPIDMRALKSKAEKRRERLMKIGRGEAETQLVHRDNRIERE